MGSLAVPSQTGAALIAKTLQQLGVKVLFGLVGIPVVEIAEEAIKLGIRFLAFRNEQAASYAATAYGYLTGKPGVCLVVGGPGVLHAMAGIGNSSANGFPLLLLAGSCETHLVGRGAFQELDAISLLTPHTKKALRASSDSISYTLSNAYRVSHYGRAGTVFVDVPADVINGEGSEEMVRPVPAPPRATADPSQIAQVVDLLKSAKAPLIVVGKGAAYARAEVAIRALIDKTNIPFLPTPMGKGVLPDSHTLNASSARSAALKHADVVLVLGARLNWILHFGEDTKWNPAATFIQVDSSAEELGHNNEASSLNLLGDISLIATQLSTALSQADFTYPASSPYISDILLPSRSKNEAGAAAKAAKPVTAPNPLTYHRAFELIKATLHALSPPEDGNTVYVSEGANTMDISRSVFPLEHPRLRLDAGTHATMGVGLGYAIAAYAAYNFPDPEGNLPTTSTTVNASASLDSEQIQAAVDSVSDSSAAPSTASHQKKKIVCLEGDSAFGFSLPEIETMARYRMPVLVFVLNNSGIYRGDADTQEHWSRLQSATTAPQISSLPSVTAITAPNPTIEESAAAATAALRSTSLSFEVRYEMAATMCGGRGHLVRTEDELVAATRAGWAETDVPTVVNVIIESGAQKKKLEFAWQKGGKK